MGETLRAVLDKSCVLKTPVFYCIEILKTVAPVSGAYDAVSGVLQLKQDRWFLCTGYSLATANLTANQYIGPTEVSLLTLRDPANAKSYSLDNEPRPLCNRNLNSWETLPEYILWGPAATIQVTGTMLTRFGGTQYIDWITLAGIEYGL